MLLRFGMLFLLLTWVTCTERNIVTVKADNSGNGNEYTLDSVRASLVRQEDTIIFGLIERAKFPFNSPTYHHNFTTILGFSASLLDFLVHNTEAVQAMAGRYNNPEENPFFPENLPHSIAPNYTFSRVKFPYKFFVEILVEMRKIGKIEKIEKVEEIVRQRVEKKAMVFGQEVSLHHHHHNHVKGKFKVDPSVVSSLYQKWLIPLTKIVEVEYFLRRLN